MSLYHGAGLYTPTPETNHIHIYIYTYIYIWKKQLWWGIGDSFQPLGDFFIEQSSENSPILRYPTDLSENHRGKLSSEPACRKPSLAIWGSSSGLGETMENYIGGIDVETRSLLGICIHIYIYNIIYTHIIHTCCNYRYEEKPCFKYVLQKHVNEAIHGPNVRLVSATTRWASGLPGTWQSKMSCNVVTTTPVNSAPPPLKIGQIGLPKWLIEPTHFQGFILVIITEWNGHFHELVQY